MKVGCRDGYSVTHGFRPVFLVSSDIVISGGEGTEVNPYILGSLE